jgi:hypothetical protein
MAYGRRNTQSPHPMYGINQPGYCVGDLPSSYNTGFVALTEVAVDTTSPVIVHGGNGVELSAQFGDAVTTCSIDVVNSEAVLLKTFNNVSKLNAGDLFIGYGDQGILLAGDPITVRAYNFVGGGKVTIKVRRTS